MTVLECSQELRWFGKVVVVGSPPTFMTSLVMSILSRFPVPGMVSLVLSRPLLQLSSLVIPKGKVSSLYPWGYFARLVIVASHGLYSLVGLFIAFLHWHLNKSVKTSQKVLMQEEKYIHLYFNGNELINIFERQNNIFNCKNSWMQC